MNEWKWIERTFAIRTVLESESQTYITIYVFCHSFPYGQQLETVDPQIMHKKLFGPAKDLEEEKLGSQMVHKEQLGPTNDE